MTKKLWLSLTMAVAMTAVLPAHAQRVLPVSLAEPAGEPPQVKDGLLEGTEKFAQGAKEVTEVNMDKNMLGMVPKGDSGMASRMDFIVVHSYTYDKPGMYRMEDVDVFRKRLTDGSWNCFVHTRDKDGSTDICTRSGDHGDSNEMVIMTAEPLELTFIHLRGKVSMSDLGKMSSSMSMSSDTSKSKDKDKDK
ncbi:DUF4252 domain-containing protein [Granulicella sp. S156]|uniref:DUF4252 domain-containing protein n=1 Tax=Granulicella sp. S156 TaxID=1747224 RepID=UPI00131AE87A|nr:DUF4252 domain-containing protein [Granulicella sp. S156]